MNETHRKTDPDGTDFSSSRWMPKRWRKWMAIASVIASSIGGLVTWFIQERRSLATREDQQNRTSIVYADRLQEITDTLSDIQDKVSNMPTRTEFYALRDQMRESQRSVQELRNSVRSSGERIEDKLEEQKTTIINLETKAKRRW